MWQALKSTAAMAWVAAAVLAAAAAASPPAGEPEYEGRIVPWRASFDGPPIPLKALGEVAIPPHYLVAADRLAALRQEALTNPDVPRGRILPGESWLKATPPPRAPEVETAFNGLNVATAGHEGLWFLPPDTIVAASVSQVLEASNVGLRLTDRQGRKEMITSLNHFFAVKYPPILFDPRVFYDRLSKRFFITATSVTGSPPRSFLYLAVSRSSAPGSLRAPADWCTYRIHSRFAGAWADYPTLGMNERWVAITTNHFSFDGLFANVFMFVAEKDELVHNASRCPAATLYRFKIKNDAAGEPAFTVQPAQHYSETTLSGTPLFFLSTQPAFYGANDYVLWRLADAGAARPRLSKIQLRGNETYYWPPPARQATGIELDTGDARVQQVAFRDGTLWAVHGTGCTFGVGFNESCVRAVAITPDDDGGQLTYQETWGGGENWYYWMPGIAVNGRGDVVVPFQRSHPDRYLGVAVAGKPAAASAFDAVRNVIRGKCSLFDLDGNGTNRTGDYVGAQADPADDLGFWIAGEFAGELGGTGSCKWKTRITRVAY